ncbi:MAG: hypothetical protein Q8M06_05445 [Methanobacteriaceae archaeon]|nr:hypothetical protein [Methanobacteriaceae archaeon]
MGEGENEVPKTILDEIIDQTVSNIQDIPGFNQKTVESLELLLKIGNTNPDKIIEVLRGE